MNSPTDAVALASAEVVLAKKGRSFHWARRLLGKTHAANATRLYGFCRHLDDIADEATSAEFGRAKLEAASRDIAAGFSVDPVIRDGIRLMEACRIPPAIAQQLITGLVSDLDPVRVLDEAALLRYCYRAAGTVGVMMCGVLDVSEPAAFVHAIDLGIAMQLTNICRDISADASMDRRYLPASLIGEMVPAELIAPAAAKKPMLRESVATLLTLADRYYASGECGLSYLPLCARSGMLVAGRVYRAIGTQLRARDCDFWTGRLAVTDRRKAALTAGALIGAPCRKSFWLKPAGHDAALHAALRGLPCVGTSHATG